MTASLLLPVHFTNISSLPRRAHSPRSSQRTNLMGYFSPGSRPRWKMSGSIACSFWSWVVTPGTSSPGQKLMPFEEENTQTDNIFYSIPLPQVNNETLIIWLTVIKLFESHTGPCLLHNDFSSSLSLWFYYNALHTNWKTNKTKWKTDFFLS